jgi:hypothetical protein
MQLPYRSKVANLTSSGDLTQSTLALFVAWITAADHTNHTFAPHDLAIAAHFFHGCLDFHLLLLASLSILTAHRAITIHNPYPKAISRSQSLLKLL